MAAAGGPRARRHPQSALPAAAGAVDVRRQHRRGPRGDRKRRRAGRARFPVRAAAGVAAAEPAAQVGRAAGAGRLRRAGGRAAGLFHAGQRGRRVGAPPRAVHARAAAVPVVGGRPARRAREHRRVPEVQGGVGARADPQDPSRDRDRSRSRDAPPARRSRRRLQRADAALQPVRGRRARRRRRCWRAR